MTAGMVAPAWMHAQISAEQYDSWSEEQCAGIEVVDGMVVVSPGASPRHNRPARVLADALDAAGPDWNADTDPDVRLQDVPLTHRRQGRHRPPGGDRRPHACPPRARTAGRRGRLVRLGDH